MLEFSADHIVQLFLVDAKFFALFCAGGLFSYYVFRCMVGLITNIGISRKYKDNSYTISDIQYDPRTNSSTEVVRTVVDWEIDHEAETSEFLAEYNQARIRASCRAARICACFFFLLLALFACAHGNYLGLNGFSISDKELKSISRLLEANLTLSGFMMVVVSLMQNAVFALGFFLASLFLYSQWYLHRSLSLRYKSLRAILFLAVFYIIGLTNGLVANITGVNFLDSLVS